ncbi:hypothetical protein PtA15_2A242 [Puccinia triticina]|uniref:Uncharacterized protein n=1 Tax=Puccinia triticina TaxID=208348 RepID=A0ABY7C9V2_9BASI|nr:uncharacterized protein PtA15_2A242 [Puccinia triticina]WAQ81929.1 hypothetical protein PtA15_2A242 [Puccinia triticina]
MTAGFAAGGDSSSGLVSKREPSMPEPSAFRSRWAMSLRSVPALSGEQLPTVMFG